MRYEPPDLVHSLVTVRKPNKIKLCIVLKDLNREIDEVIENLQDNVFWHSKLDEPSSKLLTFITPFGRYRFLRLPFGISFVPKVFSKRVQEMFSDLTGVECIVNDILLLGETIAEHNSRVHQLLQKCRELLSLTRAKWCSVYLK